MSTFWTTRAWMKRRTIRGKSLGREHNAPREPWTSPSIWESNEPPHALHSSMLNAFFMSTPFLSYHILKLFSSHFLLSRSSQISDIFNVYTYPFVIRLPFSKYKAYTFWLVVYKFALLLSKCKPLPQPLPPLPLLQPLRIKSLSLGTNKRNKMVKSNYSIKQELKHTIFKNKLYFFLQ